MTNLKIMLFHDSFHKHHGLFASWKQLNLQGQFHTAKIQNYSDVFKYLKEIIMLSLTKEGIVAQFLHEAEDFGVSLGRIEYEDFLSDLKNLIRKSIKNKRSEIIEKIRSVSKDIENDKRR